MPLEYSSTIEGRLVTAGVNQVDSTLSLLVLLAMYAVENLLQRIFSALIEEALIMDDALAKPAP